ncbi:hypothetical protein NECAME_10451 [Necator americanus]|uniref:Uncharacterized protein n=1 Tax=Necator americanus TaxID=51031 RepID=W2TAX1_NECAM|nr:hypothetical protein NECAME_10451 [Necator americanus]ETN78316.1 hypothetical protein NECAME_10451 [Necator americanus]
MEPPPKFPGEPLYRAVQNWFRARTRQELIAMGAGAVVATFGAAVIVSKYRERRRRRMLEDHVSWSSTVTVTPSTSADFDMSKSTGTRPSESYDSMKSEEVRKKDMVKAPMPAPRAAPLPPAVPLPPMPPPPHDVPPEPIPPPARAIPLPRAPPTRAREKSPDAKADFASRVLKVKGGESTPSSSQLLLPKESSPHANVLKSPINKPVKVVTGTAPRNAIIPEEKEKKERVQVDRNSITMPVKTAIPEPPKRKISSVLGGVPSKEGLKTAKTSSSLIKSKSRPGARLPTKQASKPKISPIDKKSKTDTPKKGSKQK